MQNDLDAEWMKFAEGIPMIVALQTDGVDITNGAAVPFIFGLAQCVNLKIFVIMENFARGEGLVVRNDSAIKTLADQKGKKIAVELPLS